MSHPLSHRRRGPLALTTFLALSALLALTAAPVLAAPTAQFGSQGSGAGEFLEAAGIAVNQTSGDVYISDSNNQRIDQFGSEGQFVRAFGWGVADGTTEALQTCTTTCFQGIPGEGTGQLNFAAGIAVDNSGGASGGDVYVVDSRNSRIEKFGPAGEFLLMFGGEVNATTHADVCLAAEACQAGVAGTGPGQFETLSGHAVAVGPTGTVYVADESRVQTFSGAGALQAQIPLPGLGRIENLAVDSAGDIYVVGGNAAAGARKFDAGGTELGEPRDLAANPTALTIAPLDSLFVNDGESEPAGHHLLSYDAGGEQMQSFDANAEGGSRGIAYGQTLGVVYVLNRSAVRIVTPPLPGPLVLPGSEAASDALPTSAVLNAVVNPEGGEETNYSFEYGPTVAYGSTTAPVELSGGPFEDQAAATAPPIAGLAPGTVYHFRILVTDKAGEVAHGSDQIFETLPPVSVVAVSAGAVTATTATLEAELNPHGLESSFHFEYGPTSAYGSSTPSASTAAGTATSAFEVPIQGLAAGMTYHYRVVAENGLGEVQSTDHEFTTQGTSTTLLPDGRQWELVSPADKHGSLIEPITEEGAAIQAAAGGGALAYVAKAPLEAEPAGNRSLNYQQSLARRGAGGWSNQEIVTPNESVAILRPGFFDEYKLFDEEVDAGVLEPQGATPLSQQTTERTPYRREASGAYVPLLTAANVAAGVHFGGTESAIDPGFFDGSVEFAAASPDLAHLLLVSPEPLTEGFLTEGNPSLYELSGGALKPVSILPGGESTGEAGLPIGVGGAGRNLRGAISEDGSRVFFETQPSGQERRLFLRDTAHEETLRIDLAQGGPPGEVSDAEFQGASNDGSRVFFTDDARLTSNAGAKAGAPDLYMCEITEAGPGPECRLSDLSADPNPGQAANVQGEVSAIDADGSRVFFAAAGALTSAPNSRGEVAVEGNCNGGAEGLCNLYQADTESGEVKLVAVLSSEDSPDWNAHGTRGGSANLTARVSPDGRYLAFMSERRLTGYDNRDAASRAPDQEVFILDASNGQLHCASCNPTGARPRGVFDPKSFPGLLVDHPRTWSERWLAGSIPGWTGVDNQHALYQSRYLSDSGRLFFTSSDALVPQDSNGVMDVYEYEPPRGAGEATSNSCTTISPTYGPASGGCVSLISSGTSAEESAFLDASESGDDVFFLTASRLRSADTDSAFDVYDAHVCSAALPCPAPSSSPPSACSGETCQVPALVPLSPERGTATFLGPSNPKPKRHKKKQQKTSKKKHKSKQQKRKHRRSGKTGARTAAKSRGASR